MAPKDFNSTTPDNIINSIDISFGSLCATLEGSGVNKPSQLSLFEFYSRIDYLEKKNRRQPTEQEND